MSATARTISLAVFLKLEAPSGDVNLCDGGFLYFDAGSGTEKYEAHHATFGSLASIDEFDAGFGDAAEGGKIAFHPNPAAAQSDWYSSSLRDCRVRIWEGEVDADGKTVSSAKQIGDFLVDTLARVIGDDGSVTLELELIGRAEKLFLRQEGNVASERFHKTVWAGEDGFNNCTDVVFPVAWGVAAPASGTAGGGRGGFGGVDGGGVMPRGEFLR